MDKDRAEEFFKRVAQDKEASIAFLKRAGILGEDGHLAEPYRNPDHLLREVSVSLHRAANAGLSVEKPPTGYDPEMGWIMEAATAAELAAYDVGCHGMMVALENILSGHDDGAGTSHEPWESLRRRVIALVQGKGPAVAQPSALSEFIRNASPEKKAEVYGKVMERASEAQRTALDAAQPAPAPTDAPRRIPAHELASWRRRAQPAQPAPEFEYPDFDTWWDEVEVFATRGERLVDTYFPADMTPAMYKAAAHLARSAFNCARLRKGQNEDGETLNEHEV